MSNNNNNYLKTSETQSEYTERGSVSRSCVLANKCQFLDFEFIANDGKKKYCCEKDFCNDQGINGPNLLECFTCNNCPMADSAGIPMQCLFGKTCVVSISDKQKKI